VNDARPSYTEASLARALRDGIDPAGHKLDPLMPRFVLDDAEIALLASYLRALSMEPAPGVTDNEIHFATIIAPGVSPSRAQAMLDVLRAFFPRQKWRHPSGRPAQIRRHRADVSRLPGMGVA